MPRSRQLNIQFPVNGIDQTVGYQTQPPFTCASAQNVWPRDATEGRDRGGSRPGLSAYSDAGGLVRAVRLLNVPDATNVSTQKVCVCQGSGFAVGTGGSFATVAATGSFAPTGPISMAPYGNNLYVAYDGNPQIWDVQGGTTDDWEGEITAGATPFDDVKRCRIVTFWHDRAVMGGDDENPNIWYMSRAGDPLDWDTTADDLGAAVSGSTFLNGAVGDAITALIPINRNCILIGCRDSLWVLRGDPASPSATLERLSHDVGPVQMNAYCYTYGELVMLTRDGLYVMPLGCGTAPTPLSRDRVPEAMMNVDTDDYVSMGYDHVHRAVCVSITPATGTGEHWWVDWRRKGFWEMTFEGDAQPTAMGAFRRNSTKDRGSLTLGMRDGYCAEIDRGTDQDDVAGSATDFDSFCNIGPIRLSSSIDRKATVQSLRMQRSVDGNDCQAVLQVADTAEGAQANTGFSETYTLAASTQTQHPRLTGHAGVLKLQDDDGTANRGWVFEEASMVIDDAGRTH